MKVRVTEKKSLDSLRRKMENKGYLSFSYEMSSLSEEWQYLEPGEIEFSDRLNMDRNDFKVFYYKKSRINYEMIASARKIHGENPSPNKKKDYSSARNLATYLSSKSENGQTFGKSFVNNHLKDLIIGK